jgi:hypothetical protein
MNNKNSVLFVNSLKNVRIFYLIYKLILIQKFKINNPYHKIFNKQFFKINQIYKKIKQFMMNHFLNKLKNNSF